MVRTVIIGAILGLVTAIYTRPLYRWLFERLRRKAPAAILTLLAVTVPIAVALVYSYLELLDFARYLAANETEIATRVLAKVEELPFVGGPNAGATVRRGVAMLAGAGTNVPEMLQETFTGLAVATAIFVFTAFYVFTDAERILNYLRGHVPPRYTEL